MPIGSGHLLFPDYQRVGNVLTDPQYQSADFLPPDGLSWSHHASGNPCPEPLVNFLRFFVVGRIGVRRFRRCARRFQILLRIVGDSGVLLIAVNASRSVHSNQFFENKLAIGFVCFEQSSPKPSLQNYFQPCLALFRGLRHSVTAHIGSAMELGKSGLANVVDVPLSLTLVANDLDESITRLRRIDIISIGKSLRICSVNSC